MKNFKAGLISIVGKPNVGKSTLINQLVGTKISITANKPQTTRQLIRGIKTTDDYQMVFIDTPGLGKVLNSHKNPLNQKMLDQAKDGFKDMDLILWITDSCFEFNDDEFAILNLIKNKAHKCPVFLVINKIDTLNDQEKLIEIMQQKSSHYAFNKIIAISAFNGKNIKKLTNMASQYLPNSPAFYEKEQIIDLPFETQIEEMIREKCMRDLFAEIPYQIGVKVKHIEQSQKLAKIYAQIWVASDSHKKILIGSKGQMIKQIGIHARYNLEKHLFHKKVYLDLMVKVQNNWFERISFFNNF